MKAPSTLPSPALEVNSVSRTFGAKQALTDVSMTVAPGEIRALLGPNGAGKTTLLRILAGLVEPSSGSLRLVGQAADRISWRQRCRLFSLVPSGERTFYLRLSGEENLLFFARLHGMTLGQAKARARRCLGLVGLEDAGGTRVGLYSSGMQKRLAIARALLINPPVMLIDEATQSLDPQGSRTTKDLVREAASQGTAVVWATQRVDEIRGFAHRVTLLNLGRVRFDGSVPDLMAVSATRRYLLRLDTSDRSDDYLGDRANEALADLGRLEKWAGSAPGHYSLWLHDSTTLGDAIAALVVAGCRVLSCREEVSEVEEAFVTLTSEVGT